MLEPLPCRSAKKPVRNDCSAEVSADGVAAPGLVEVAAVLLGLVEALVDAVAVVLVLVPFKSATNFVKAEFSEEIVPADNPELLVVPLRIWLLLRSEISDLSAPMMPCGPY